MGGQIIPELTIGAEPHLFAWRAGFRLEEIDWVNRPDIDRATLGQYGPQALGQLLGQALADVVLRFQRLRGRDIRWRGRLMLEATLDHLERRRQIENCFAVLDGYHAAGGKAAAV